MNSYAHLPSSQVVGCLLRSVPTSRTKLHMALPSQGSRFLAGANAQHVRLQITRRRTKRCGGVHGVKVEARRGSRDVMFNDESNYVLLEPGKDEEFVTGDELQAKLTSVLDNWDGPLPTDLQGYESSGAAAEYLIEGVCELDLEDGQGSLQWFQVRLEQ
ncbi:hypothetical protein CYMTET_7969 [Cymbomonas tetramitiformis]|uniref:Chlororespiratory reduction 7 n=1 Tax=Cymbomonas tetramitiformis TaxID=36881 RepID=A0AAE0GU70_9CHLO|nr:hypothetical protein CYMTET_7969 [Cymbomonas tetramitiformis]